MISNIDTLLLTGSEKDIKTAAQLIIENKLVAFPTETVYGLGGNALSPTAASAIYAAKGRPSDNPLIVHICDTKAVYELATTVPDKAVQLMEAFWPGPLTIILPKKEIVPDTTTGGLNTVAIRMPSHPAALSLIRESGIYIAAPSANSSGRPSPTTAEHVADDLSGRIDAIIDGGAVGIGIESTIVDLTSDTPTILRPGFITKKMLEEIIGPVAIDPTLIEPDPNLRPKAPGMKYTHYAPKGELYIVEKSSSKRDINKKTTDGEVSHKDTADREAAHKDTSDREAAHKEIADKIIELYNEKKELGYSVKILAPSEHAGFYNKDDVITVGSLSDGVTVSARLYAALRECDAAEAEFIYSESFEENDLGGAIMNRLLKAAGHKVIRVP